MEKDIIYTRDLDLLVYPPWQPIMGALIKTIDSYYEHEEDKNKEIESKIFISYVKDKYGFLRCEYSGGNEYVHNLIEAVEDLSFYIK